MSDIKVVDTYEVGVNKWEVSTVKIPLPKGFIKLWYRLQEKTLFSKATNKHRIPRKLKKQYKKAYALKRLGFDYDMAKKMCGIYKAYKNLKDGKEESEDRNNKER